MACPPTDSSLYPSFHGLLSDNDTTRLGLDFQRMLRINHMLYIAARSASPSLLCRSSSSHTRLRPSRLLFTLASVTLHSLFAQRRPFSKATYSTCIEHVMHLYSCVLLKHLPVRCFAQGYHSSAVHSLIHLTPWASSCTSREKLYNTVHKCQSRKCKNTAFTCILPWHNQETIELNNCMHHIHSTLLVIRESP